MSDYVDPKYRNLRNLLLSANGEITPEIKNEVERLTNGQQAENFKDIMDSINDGVTSEDILGRISRIPLPKIFLDSVTSTFKTALSPTKLSFMEEMQNYIKVISDNNAQITREIPRTVKKIDLKKLENGKFVQAFPDADRNEKVINPEFKQLLQTGYVPRDVQEYQRELKTEHPELFMDPPRAPQESSDPFTDFRIGIREPTIGTPSSDFLKNYIGGNQPSTRIEKIPYSTSKPAALLMDSYKLKDEEVTIKSDNSKLIIELSGTMRIETIDKQLLNSTFFSNLPSWKISYLETKDRYFLNIKNNLQYFPLSNITPETSSYRFSGKIPETSLSQEALNLIGVLSDQCDVQLGDDLFSSLLGLDNVVDDDQNFHPTPRNKNLFADEKSDLKQYLKESFKEMFDSVVRQTFGNLNNNRLLKKFNPNPDLYDSSKSPISLITLNLVNFIPNPSQDLIDCNKNPHPLNLDEVMTLIGQKFSDVGLEVIPSDDTIQKKEDPTTEALAVAVAYMIVRLFVFEYVLKNLIVFDELGYSSTINNGPIIKDYVSILAKKELDSKGIYKSVEKIIDKNYDFFIKNDIIRQEDISEEQDGFSSIVDNSSFVKPSKNFKIFTTALLRKVIGFTKNLIGIKQDIAKGDLLIGSKIYNVVSRNNLDSDVEKKYNGFDIKRLEDLKDYKQILLFEKYVNIPEISFDPFLNINTHYDVKTAQEVSGAANVTSLREYSEFLYKLINFEENFGTNKLRPGNPLKNHIINNNGKIKESSKLKLLFGNNKSKLGIRLNYVKREDIYSGLVNLLPIAVREQQFNLGVLSNENNNITDQDDQTKNITGISKQLYSSYFESDSVNKFFIKNNKQRSVNIIKEEIIKNRQYCFFDDNVEGIYKFNSLPVSKYEIEFDVEEIFSGVSNIGLLTKNEVIDKVNRFYNSKKQNILLNLKNTPNYQLLVNKAVGIDRINNLMSIYSTSALSNTGMKKLFERTKENLRSLLSTVENLENYEYKSELSKTGYDNLYMKDLANVGNPNAGPNILKFLIQTPILILKGLLNVTDPNMSLSFIFQDIAAAGLLFPKLDEQGNVVGYPGEKLVLPSALLSMAQLPINVFGIPPAGFGVGPPFTIPYAPIFWGLEPLLWDWPFYKNALGETKEAASLSTRYNGLNVTNFTCSKNQDDN